MFDRKRRGDKEEEQVEVHNEELAAKEAERVQQPCFTKKCAPLRGAFFISRKGEKTPILPSG
jgi:hypothetical protein